MAYNPNQGLTLIEHKTASNSASIEFTRDFSKYANLILIFNDVLPATTGYLCLLVSNDGGSTYLITGYQSGINTSPYNLLPTANVNVTDKMLLAGVMSGVAGELSNGVINLNSINTGGYITMSGKTNIVNTGLFYYEDTFSMNTATNVNAIRLIMLGNSGNILSGKFSLYGFN